MGLKIKEMISGAGKAAKGLAENVIQRADRNGDGKIDLLNVVEIAGNVGNTVKDGLYDVRDNIEAQTKQARINALKPIFEDSDIQMTKFVRITERDKRYAEKGVCPGAIGCLADQKNLHITNVFRDSVDAFGVEFYPGCDCEFYYIDPSDRNRYLALDEYFGYLKSMRINELQKIAQDLGAKHFKITYKEEKASLSERKDKGKVKIASADAEVSRSTEEKEYSKIEVAAEMSFPGHAPKRPKLKYMQRDASVQNLVVMRLDKQGPVNHYKLILNMSDSSGMKESDAVKIDAVLKGLKCAGNTTVESEVKNEARRYLEYEIEF